MISKSTLNRAFSPVHGFLFFIFAMAGCNGEFYDVVSRKVADPAQSVPKVFPFQSIEGITVSWESDELADSFVLYRKLLPSGPTTAVYKGRETVYQDTTALPSTMYEYTLAKVRGTKEFEAGDPAYSAYDAHRVMDPNGYNDTRSSAKPFTTYQVSDFIVYYADGQGNVIADEDWYYMDLDPHTLARIRLPFWDCDLGSTQQDLSVRTDVSRPMSNGGEFTFSNGENVPRRVYFSIGKNLGVVNLVWKKMWSYNLDFVSIETYNP